MGDFTLRVKHWQVFLGTMLLMLVGNLTIEDSTLASATLSAIGYCIFSAWLALIGNSLFPFLPRKAEYNLTWFLIDVAVGVVARAAVIILTDERSFQAAGLPAVALLYIIFAQLHGPWFLAVSLVAIEKQREPEFGSYFGTLLLFLFWPVGLWVLQPRLNKVWQDRQAGLPSVEKIA
ncbi:hypothetical protein [Hymenobacter cellulosilyticus]|uniref:Uncharacterized protein n=1 Tax=Hymenobacter cellulosilyticus TaxID=2932248 RepID=A0A8T9QDI2_9BACT|nr:hypothetical protein [Hymenobacter cellulosilyticus]UOQ73890.1 hypothetical protein MUN79_08270 [Hymenobacter cellulosilyticus]